MTPTSHSLTPDPRRRRRPRNPDAGRQHRPTPGTDQPGADQPEAAGSRATSAATGGFAALGVPAKLVAALDTQGLTDPFPIQAATLPDSMSGRDVLGQGRTGSGKTLAFALPLVARLGSLGGPSKPGRPRGLVLVPTRELANQVCAVIEPLGRAVGLRTATVYGGVGPAPQLKAFAAGVDIIVACPGRLLDHMSTRAVALSDVAVTVIDEADHMADQGFLPMVRKILDATPNSGQRLLFSATLAGGVDQIVDRYLTAPVSHKAQAEAPAELEHRVTVIDETDRLATLIDLIGDERAVVFTRTKHRARQMARKLDAAGIRAVDLHGNLSQPARERNLAAFAGGQAQVLVATDIAARGIHIDDIPLVIHADPPVEHKAYTHRSGRTARAGARGVVITIAARDQVGEVKKLLTRAGVQASWNGADTGRPAASAAPADRRRRR